MFLEQPLRMNIGKVLSNKLFNRPIQADDIFIWDDTEMVSAYQLYNFIFISASPLYSLIRSTMYLNLIHRLGSMLSRGAVGRFYQGSFLPLHLSSSITSMHLKTMVGIEMITVSCSLLGSLLPMVPSLTGQIVLDVCAHNNWRIYSTLDLKGMNDLYSSDPEVRETVQQQIEPRRYVLPLNPIQV